MIEKGASLFLLGISLGFFGITKVYHLCKEEPNGQRNKVRNEKRRAIIAGGSILVGWLITIYGGVLLASSLGL